MTTLMTSPVTASRDTALILWFDQIGIDDIPLVGGKNASLGEMYRELAPHGVRVPNGFALTASAYRCFLRERDLEARIRHILQDLDTQSVENLQQRGAAVREAILATPMPHEIESAIVSAYRILCSLEGRPAAFVGQHSGARNFSFPAGPRRGNSRRWSGSDMR